MFFYSNFPSGLPPRMSRHSPSFLFLNLIFYVNFEFEHHKILLVYLKNKQNNNTIYSNKNIQIILDKNNKIKKVVLFTDYYQVLGNIRVGDNKDILDYPNNKVTPTKYIASSEKKTVKMTYLLSNNKITKIMLS